MGWILLAVAVAANIASNFLFKTAMASFPETVDAASLFKFAFNPYLWLGGTACVVLLASYLLALREIDLMTSYAFVISLSLVGITVLSPLLLGTTLPLGRIAGVALVISGILLLTLSYRVPSLGGAASVPEAGAVRQGPPA
jgi:multidrug transporter EmrE-like cation transporter